MGESRRIRTAPDGRGKMPRVFPKGTQPMHRDGCEQARLDVEREESGKRAAGIQWRCNPHVDYIARSQRVEGVITGSY